ncbi:MAG TPA: hypothetical protein VN663_22815 [Ramlibacter sp.]|nr:hypothetical protein [Ramlibacter sp.]
MARFKITCRCLTCGNVWKFTTKDPEAPDPPCPRPVRFDAAGKVVETCGHENRVRGMDLSSNRAPGIGGENIHNKAIDETAAMVMHDYGMTDLSSDVREGETAAPKLPPRQQAMADNYFGGAGGRRPRMGVNLAGHAAAALSGRLSDPASTNRSIGAVHANRVRPPVHIVNRQG